MKTSAAQQAALRYVELVNAQSFELVGDLFSEDAIVLTPTGELVEGRDAIRALWAEQYSRSGPSAVSVASATFDDRRCVLELSPQLPGEDAPREGMVIDHFTVDDAGDICRLAIYLRPAGA
jgi:hypothetical protein